MKKYKYPAFKNDIQNTKDGKKNIKEKLASISELK